MVTGWILAVYYKVEGIPSKFVINKQGEMVYAGDRSIDISWVIENVRK
jgi:hypothetical protein